MINTQNIFLYLILSVVVVAVKMIFFGRRDPVGFILCFYLFFAFGPVVNYLLGEPIYFGIVEENIEEACLIMFLGIFSFSGLHIFLPNPPIKTDSIIYKEHRWEALRYIYFISFLYSAARILIMLPYRLGGASKIELINIALPGIHYVYLLLQLYLTAFYFNIDKPKLKKLYWLNFIAYITYCLIISERDFIFPIFSILVVKMITSQKYPLRYLFMSAALVGLATLIFFFRDSSQESGSVLAGILNQGSILFINSYVLKIFSDGELYFNGYTYVNSLLNLLPSWIYKTDFNSLAWFHNKYAPTSTSGYGFSLDAEGYMNFGYYGVIGFFVALSIYWKLLMRLFYKSSFITYLTVFSTGFCMYSLRNDSLALLKGTLYAMVIYLLINTASYIIAIGKK